MQKLYCYVDETGQDAGSEFFIVVTVISDKEQQSLRDTLINIELLAGTGRLKWHKSRHERRMKYLEMVLQRKIGHGEVFFGKYKKPLPYFFPMLETLKKAIINKIDGDYRAVVFVDGIDKKKAVELTNALRIGGLKLKMARGKRDESEPLIRLADMWAGCIRDAFFTGGQAKIFFQQALKIGYLFEIDKNKNPLRGLSISAIPDKSGPISAIRTGLRRGLLLVYQIKVACQGARVNINKVITNLSILENLCE